MRHTLSPIFKAIEEDFMPRFLAINDRKLNIGWASVVTALESFKDRYEADFEKPVKGGKAKAEVEPEIESESPQTASDPEGE